MRLLLSRVCGLKLMAGRPVMGIARCLIPSRSYHSRQGVYGYKQDPPRTYQLSADVIKRRSEESNIYRYISAFQEYGHLKANINPLDPNTRIVPELDPTLYGLQANKSYDITGLLSGIEGSVNLEQLTNHLENKYCGLIGAEFSYLPTIEEREWFSSHLEGINDFEISNDVKKQLATDMLHSQSWDNFLAIKFQSVKRYGGEGAEAAMAYYSHTLKALAQDGVEQVVVGMAHRGRLNLLTGLLQFPPVIMYQKMKGMSEWPKEVKGSGDVLSHLVSSVDLAYGDHNLHVTMMPNPSHLEAVNPVVVGKARGRQRSLAEGHYSESEQSQPGDKVVCLQIHGDAAVAGQGVIQETVALSNVPHFAIGGSLHVCINNQVGYTTPGERTRSTTYCTDVAKMAAMPVIHVNGDHPEAVVRAAQLAVEYQRKFRRDIWVDLICWRRWGHNELDNPRFTNPDMYQNIDARRSVPDVYVDSLVDSGIMTREEVLKINSDYNSYLAEQFKLVDTHVPKANHLEKQWSGFVQSPSSIEVWDTGVDVSTLKYVAAKSVELPEEFNVHGHLNKTHCEARIKKVTEGQGLDWATAEACAFGSLLHQGYNIRISGQDVGRGTFSQRHCMFVDQKDASMYIPFNHMAQQQTGHLEVVNSILSEEAVLGFEYGVSVESPNTLCIWEAQFGDFYNGAQIMIDTFVSSGETKWLTQSGLVMLLPHGYDGAGPEHSSCHIERFLQNCDSKEDRPDGEDINWGVVNPTNGAQYFHLLRRQMIRNYRKPLIIAGPKALLRLPVAAVSLSDMASGTHFLPVIGDGSISPDQVRRVVFVSGKHYYTLDAERQSRGLKDTAIVRIEALCPFPTAEINTEMAKYKNAKQFVWSQEEHRNMGAWFFVNPRFNNLCGTKLSYAGRDVLGTPAVGIGQLHKKEVQDILDQTFKS